MRKIAKYGLFFANIVFNLSGLALVVVSIAGTLQLTVLLDIVPRTFSVIPRAMIILGLLIIFIAFLGYWSRSNKYFLFMYALSMLLLATSKIYLTVVIYKNLQIIDRLVAEWLGDAFHDKDMRDKFHDVEIAFRCCGTYGPGSYAPHVLPYSCCPQPHFPEIDENCNFTNAYKGCNGILSSFYVNNGGAVWIIMIIIVVVEIAGIIFSLYIYIADERRKRRT